jgi:hypothetical protein
LIPPAAATALLLSAVVFGAVAGFGLSGGKAAVVWVGTAMIAGAGVSVVSIAVSLDAPLTRIDLTRLAGRSGRRRFWRDLRGSAAWASLFGVIVLIGTSVTIDWPAGVVFGPMTALLLTIGFQVLTLGTELGPAVSPSALVKQCLMFSMACWVTAFVPVAALTTLLGAYLGWGLHVVAVSGLSAGLVVATGLWLADGNGAVWIRYALGVRSAARRNLLPRHPARFLDWCVSVGLMRMSGNTIQFRHKQLQEWLILRAERSAAASPTG